MRRTHAIAAVALLGLLVAPVSAFATSNPAGALGTGGSSVRLTTLAPRVPAGAARVGSLPASQPITLTIVLRPSHTDRLATLLRDLYDPASPRYQQWLPKGEFARDFGPSTQQIDAVTSWLHQQGLRDTTVQGMAVHARGTAGAVARALGVSFSKYRLHGAATGYVASAAPLVPRALAGDITSIVGLSDTVRLHNSLRIAPVSTRGSRSRRPAGVAKVAAATGCVNARSFAGDKFWTPAQISSLYGIDNLFAAGLTGKGKSIALVEFAPSVANDTNSFLSCFALHNKVAVVPVNGGSPTDPEGTVEAEVDIQEAATQAPARRSSRTRRPTREPASTTFTTRSCRRTAWRLCRRVGRLRVRRRLAGQFHRRDANGLPTSSRAGPERVRGQR